MKKYIVITLLATVGYIALSYLERGYWAVGLEIFFPLFAGLTYEVKKSLE